MGNFTVDLGANASVIGTVLVAFIGGGWAWIKTRTIVNKKPIAAQEAINAGFQVLITELQKEREKLMQVIEQQTAKIADQSRIIHQLRNDVHSLSLQVESLKTGRRPRS